MNDYSYGLNNSVRWIDPFGLQSKPSEVPLGDSYKVIQDFWDGVGDLWGEYENLRQANTIGTDSYFHCLGNCEASRRGPGGRAASHVVSYVREVYGVAKGDPWTDTNQDMSANSCGRNGPNSQSCPEWCSQYLPPVLPPSFPRP